MEGHINGVGLFDFEVAGESKYQAALDDACGGRTFEGVSHRALATLILESDNPADSNAVRVEINGRTVGYLTREDAPSYRTQLARAGYPELVATCDAVIVGGWNRGDGDAGMFGVKLDLPRGTDDDPPPVKHSAGEGKVTQLRVVCTGCGKGIRAPHSFAGRRVHCPGCGAAVAFPAT